MKQSIQEQLQREMTRKQFLQLMAVAVFSILGINNLVNLLSRTAKSAAPANPSERHGFGASKFGE